jgi:hypothetical protein
MANRDSQVRLCAWQPCRSRKAVRAGIRETHHPRASHRHTETKLTENSSTLTFGTARHWKSRIAVPEVAFAKLIRHVDE